MKKEKDKVDEKEENNKKIVDKKIVDKKEKINETTQEVISTPIEVNQVDPHLQQKIEKIKQKYGSKKGHFIAACIIFAVAVGFFIFFAVTFYDYAYLLNSINFLNNIDGLIVLLFFLLLPVFIAMTAYYTLPLLGTLITSVTLFGISIKSNKKPIKIISIIGTIISSLMLLISLIMFVAAFFIN